MAEFYEFIPGSPLRRFIYNAKKTIKIYYQLHEVITLVREIIRDNCLYDKTNTAVIVCDSELEKVFNTNGMHESELKGKILEQLIFVAEPLQGRLRAAWQRHVAEQAAGAPAPDDADLEPEPANRNDTATTSKIEYQKVATVYKYNTIPRAVYTDEHARFLISQGLTEVLSTLPEFDRSKHTFSYRQIVP
ncbi:MAG: SWIB/MDM2 domain-containing protein, partial [bacterium]